jgi:hypothetical protein
VGKEEEVDMLALWIGEERGVRKARAAIEVIPRAVALKRVRWRVGMRFMW